VKRTNLSWTEQYCCTGMPK